MKKLLGIIFIVLIFPANLYAEGTYLTCGETQIYFGDHKGYEKYKVNKEYKEFKFEKIITVYDYVYLNRENVEWKINRFTGEGIKKVGSHTFNHKCKKVEKKF